MGSDKIMPSRKPENRPNKDFDHSQIHPAAWRPLTDFCARKRACIVL